MNHQHSISDLGIKAGATASGGSGLVASLEEHATLVTSVCAIAGLLIALISFVFKLYFDFSEENRKRQSFNWEGEERRNRQKKDSGMRRRKDDKIL